MIGPWGRFDLVAGWARPSGVPVGGVLAIRRAPFPLVVIAAAATTAALRLWGVPWMRPGDSEPGRPPPIEDDGRSRVAVEEVLADDHGDPLDG